MYPLLVIENEEIKKQIQELVEFDLVHLHVADP